MFEAIVSVPHDGERGLSDAAYADLRSLLSDLARTRARQGFTPTETAGGVFVLKEAVLEMLEAKADLEAYAFFAEFSRFVDALGLFMLDTYAQTRESVIAEQSASLLELSTPVVRLWEGIVTLPLVGTLDSARTQVVMEKLLEALVSTGSDHAIIDITGVPAVDTQVAQHLLKTVMAARLLGGVHHLRRASTDRPDRRRPGHRLRHHRHEVVAVRRPPAGTEKVGVRRRQTHRDQGAVMERIPILRLGDILLVSIQVDLQDHVAVALQEDLAERIVEAGADGVLIDITALEIVDSFIGRMISTIASISKVLDAETVVVGMRPAVAITLVEALGLSLSGVRTALDVDRGLRMLRADRAEAEEDMAEQTRTLFSAG